MISFIHSSYNGFVYLIVLYLWLLTQYCILVLHILFCKCTLYYFSVYNVFIALCITKVLLFSMEHNKVVQTSMEPVMSHSLTQTSQHLCALILLF